MARFFASYIVPVMLLIISLFDPVMPACEGCNSTGFVTCDVCGGDGTVYSAEYDLHVTCDACGASGDKLCSDCPDYAQFYYSFKANLEEYTK